ncbi:hypothetical protein [Desulfopila inferna]|uniref:hypothetical protein n=1 Tax=Desulfopila inferna TaxID=468528 RepID=UPI0019654748|nr:hypothetical protein [Desulfopila inferna]MBM9604654.1 hypothetical protein [Desulfopila inferna]
MFGLTDVIVSLWFLPMALFIILPLVMLCGWLVFKTVAPRKLKHTAPIMKQESQEESIPGV